MALRVFIQRKKFYRKEERNVKHEEAHDYSKSIASRITYRTLMIVVLVLGVYGISITIYYAFILLAHGTKDLTVIIFSDVIKELIFRYLHL